MIDGFFRSIASFYTFVLFMLCCVFPLYIVLEGGHQYYRGYCKEQALVKHNDELYRCYFFKDKKLNPSIKQNRKNKKTKDKP